MIKTDEKKAIKNSFKYITGKKRKLTGNKKRITEIRHPVNSSNIHLINSSIPKEFLFSPRLPNIMDNGFRSSEVIIKKFF